MAIPFNHHRVRHGVSVSEWLKRYRKHKKIYDNCRLKGGAYWEMQEEAEDACYADPFFSPLVGNLHGLFVHQYLYLCGSVWTGRNYHCATGAGQLKIVLIDEHFRSLVDAKYNPDDYEPESYPLVLDKDVLSFVDRFANHFACHSPAAKELLRFSLATDGVKGVWEQMKWIVLSAEIDNGKTSSWAREKLRWHETRRSDPSPDFLRQELVWSSQEQLPTVH